MMIIKQTRDFIMQETSKIIIGQNKVIEELILCYLAGGHVILESVPGLAKTLLAKTFAHVTGITFSRIQFTPDLMPSDILGNSIYNLKNQQFEFKKGPVFTNILLADEINRASPKTQSALLEIMQERQVTVDGVTHTLSRPFITIATQNPLEQEGTYPLPEAQADRFIFKIKVSYPTYDDEIKIVDLYAAEEKEKRMKVLLNKNHLLTLQGFTRQVPIANDIKQRAVKIVLATRQNKEVIQYGASPRASIGLILASKARALIQGRNHVSNDDLNVLAYPILRHRIILNFEAERKGMSKDDAIKSIIDKVK